MLSCCETLLAWPFCRTHSKRVSNNPLLHCEFCALLLGNLISHPALLLTFSTAFIHSSHKIIHSILQFTLFLLSPLSLSLLHRLLPFTHLFLSFLISNSLPLPNSHSYPSVCLPLLPHPISLSVSRSISRLQEMVSFPIQGVGGVYSLSQTKRSLCESSKNTKKKRKTDKNQKPSLIRLSHTNTHAHTLYLCCMSTKHFCSI